LLKPNLLAAETASPPPTYVFELLDFKILNNSTVPNLNLSSSYNPTVPFINIVLELSIISLYFSVSLNSSFTSTLPSVIHFRIIIQNSSNH
jgi:hypothetical protein